ncbi:MAG: O-antigen ligase family protein, partial [Oscillibacter sp.]
MKLLRESYLYVLWASLCSVYEESRLHRCVACVGAWCNRQVDSSALLSVLCREGAVARVWADSTLCRLLTALVNFPGWLLHKLYLALQPLFDGSLLAPLVFELGEETAVAQSWLVMLLWVIPFKRWNNAYSLLGFAALLLLFYAGAMGRKAFRLDIKSIGFYPVLFFGAVILGVVFSYVPSISLRFLFYHVSAALCVLVTVSAVRCGEDLKRLAAGGGFVVLISSLYGVYQRMQGVKVNKSFVDLNLNVGMPGRVASFFDNPNTFAEVLILLLPLVLALILCSEHLLSKAVACGIFAVGVAALGMTYSRASWVGIACACVVMVFLWKPKLIPLFLLFCVLCIPLLPDTIWNRILTIANPTDTSTASRFPLYRAALNVIKEAPVTGAGLGTTTVQEYISDLNLYHGKAPFVHAHNFYLQVWIEAGLLGIVGFVGSLLWGVKTAARTVRHCPDSAARTITCAAAAAMCGAMVCGLADYLWNYPRVMCMFWFVFALALAGAKVCRNTAEEIP